MDIMGNKWPIQSQLVSSQARSVDNPCATLTLINHSTRIEQSKTTVGHTVDFPIRPKCQINARRINPVSIQMCMILFLSVDAY